MEDRMNKDISGIVDNLNEMNELVDYDEQFRILMDVYHLYPETPQHWYSILIRMAKKISDACISHGFEASEVSYMQVKSKWDDLRVYHTMERVFQDDLTDDEFDRLESLQADVCAIIDEAEEEVNDLVEAEYAE